MMTAIPSNLCELFTQAVQRCPNNLAVDHRDGCLTYCELDETSSVLARNLARIGVTNGSPVLLVTAHGTFNLVAILAIIKAGGCFVPIDRRTWSSEMIEYVFDTVDSPIVINTTVEPLAVPSGIRHVLHITALSQPEVGKHESSLVFPIEPEDTACIVFTSGSTGKPKGVMISHRSLCLYSRTSPINLDISPGDRLLHMLSVAFDACACILFSVLGSCGTVVPVQPEDVYFKASSCTVMAATPSLLNNLPSPAVDKSICCNMHTIILGGETATPDVLGLWIDAGVRVLTAYGVTETTSMGCINDVERDPRTGKIDPFLIGGFMEESPIYLLNDDLTVITEDLVEGEIVIAGDGVAQGYYKDELKTKGNFIRWNGIRIYRTGDYGKWVRAPAGHRVIEFRGRKDRTVKNRGFLVNLDRDVEDALYHVGASLGVRSVRATATEYGIAVVVTPSCVDTTILLEKAKHSMCSYCIPSRIEVIEDFPLSSNGKVQPRSVLDIIEGIDKAKGPIVTMNVTSPFPEVSISDRTGERDKLAKVLRAATEVFRFRGVESKTIQGEDSFIGLGGSSLLAFKLVSVLLQNNLHISVRDLFNCRTFSEIGEIAAETPDLIKATPRTIDDPSVTKGLADLHKQAQSTLGLIDNTFDIGPLTSLQLELALPTLVDKSRCINQIKLTYSGTCAGMIERAWRVVWQTEPVFRTEISLEIGCGAQIVHRKPFRKPQLSVYDARKNYEIAVKDASMSIGLGCTLEFLVFHQSVESTISKRGTQPLTEKDELTVVLTVHHSLMDGFSLNLVLEKVVRAAQGRSIPHNTSSIDASLGLIAIQRRRDAEARAFFTTYLKEVPQENNATERARIGAQRKMEGLELSMQAAFFLSSVAIDEVMEFARQRCVSAACIYYTAWAMAMSTLENNTCVVIGSVFSDRATQIDYEDTIGPYMSTLPLVFRFDVEETVAARLQQTMSSLMTLGEYAWARSDQVGIARRMGNLLAMQLPLPDHPSIPPPMTTVSLENSDFPLSMLVEANGNLRVLYDNAQFDDHTVQRIVEHFKHSLHSLLHETLVKDCMRINRLQVIALEHAAKVRTAEVEQTVKWVLERSIDRFLGMTALEDCSGAELTYGELDRLTNIIAHRINASLSDARVVALYGDGTTGWILGLLGILKAGRTYAPLDPKWPMDRRAAVCEKSGAAALLLPSAAQMLEAPGIEAMKVLAVDTILNAKHSECDFIRLPDSSSPSSDFVVVFTSGTTGTPKGVPISNCGFLALQSNPEATMFAAPGRRIAQFMSPAFDYCNVEIFSALLHGATLVLRDPLDPYAHLRKVNTATITPSVLSVLDLDEFPNIEILYSTGEPVTGGLVNKFASRTLFYNAYGPAECSICTSFTRMIPGDEVTIGMAIDTTRMYILDSEQRHVQDGVRGEIYLAGIQVLREYVNAPEQTALRILSDLWHEGERMFRTGDYGMRGKDKRITYMGRIDRQVKIRGFRVELAGVEQAIMSGPVDEEIVQCAAFAVNGTLAAFITFRTSHENGESERRINRLRDRLIKKLLPSWVPQTILTLKEFPRSANGKIDIRELEATYTRRMSARNAVPLNSAPNHSIECKLADQWRQVLQLDPDMQLHDSDDFFRLGGHSVLVILLAARLTAAFGVNITARELLPTPSLRGQINCIRQLLQDSVDVSHWGGDFKSKTNISRQHNNVLSTNELTELERLVWFQYQVATTTTAFNIAKIINLMGKVNMSSLVNSLNTALASDLVFRSNIVEGLDGPRRSLCNSVPKVREVAQLDINAEVNHYFDPSRDELIRIHLIRNPNEGKSDGADSVAQLVIVTSHIISDLGTLQNLLRLTSLAYSGTVIKVHKRPQHLNSNRWLQRSSPADRKFWKDYLNGHSYEHQKKSLLQRSDISPPLATFEGASRTREFTGDLVTTLNALIRRLGVTHHQLGLAATALTLQWLSAENDIVLGAPNANRLTLSEQEALGQFLDRLPVRVRLNQDASEVKIMTSTVLTEVRDSAHLAIANAIPFSSILEVLKFPNGALRHPIFECMVTFHPRGAGLENWLQLPNCEISSSSEFAGGSKFPLMLEWFELDSDRWSLHIEHDTNYFLPVTIAELEDALEIVLSAIGDECSICDLKARLGDPPLADLSDESPSPILSYHPCLESSKNVEHLLSVEEMTNMIQSQMATCLTNGEILSPDVSFFSTGADSTAVVALRYRLRKVCLDIPLREIFVAQTPLKLAEHVVLYMEKYYVSGLSDL